MDYTPVGVSTRDLAISREWCYNPRAIRYGVAPAGLLRRPAAAQVLPNSSCGVIPPAVPALEFWMRDPSHLALARQIDDIATVGFDPTLSALMRAHGAALPAPADAWPRLGLDWLGRSGWFRLPAWLRRGLAWLVNPVRDLAALSLRGPLLLLMCGSLLSLTANAGPWPGIATPVSLTLALLVFHAASHLACRGRSWVIAAAVVVGGLLLTPLWLGPQPLPYCKVTSFNAWAFALGKRLPSWGLPPANPNAVAGVLAVGLAFATAGALQARSRLRRCAAGAGAALLTLCLMLTASRTGWLAGAAAVAFVAASRGRRALIAALAVAALAIVGLTASDPTLRSLSHLAARGDLWQNTIALLRRQPIIGLGLGRTAWLSPSAATTVHNALLQLWADTGLLGLTAVGWALTRALRARTALARRRMHLGWALAGLDGALAAFALQSLCETNTLFVGQIAGLRQLVISPLPFALLGTLAGLDAYSRRLARAYVRAPSRQFLRVRAAAPDSATAMPWSSVRWDKLRTVRARPAKVRTLRRSQSVMR